MAQPAWDAVWHAERAVLEAALTRRVSVGVLGGSISAGAGLSNLRDAYPNLLAGVRRLQVTNHAIRASGVALPSRQ